MFEHGARLDARAAVDVVADRVAVAVQKQLGEVGRTSAAVNGAFLKGGELVDKQVGACPKDALKAKIEKLL